MDDDADQRPGSSADHPAPRDRALWRRRLLVPAAFAVILGILGGIGSFTFSYGQGFSYMMNEPGVCANCHVMQDHFDAWQKSSHHHVAVCNDCHLPHDFAGKWFTKTENGLFHSMAFTFDTYERPIQIRARNRRVTQSACLHCHGDFVHPMLPATESAGMLRCVHCHGDVGHAGDRRRGAIARDP
jgi:cytochrome c nitrite reductase small subunit